MQVQIDVHFSMKCDIIIQEIKQGNKMNIEKRTILNFRKKNNGINNR